MVMGACMWSGHRDVYRIELFPVEQLPPVLIKLRVRDLGAHLLAERPVDIAKRHDLDGGMRKELGEIALADPADSDAGMADFFLGGGARLRTGNAAAPVVARKRRRLRSGFMMGCIQGFFESETGRNSTCAACLFAMPEQG